jgi:hypothetical protein
MIGVEKTLAQRALITLIDLRGEQPPNLEYLMALGRAMAPQLGVKYLDSVAADKRAAAYRALTSLTQTLQKPGNVGEIDALWDEAIAQTRVWLGVLR